MKIKNWREFAFIFMTFASILWFILTFLAMLFYAGGTYLNPNSPGYDFFSNFNASKFITFFLLNEDSTDNIFFLI